MMKKILSILFVLLAVAGYARQGDKTEQVSPAEVEAYQRQIADMVEYLFETLNFIGDSLSPVSEKETIFNESWTKIFVNDNVMIEDDLDLGRAMTVNKDVRSYLRDIDFFFKYAKFSYEIEKIDLMTTESGSIFFKVGIKRTISATGLSDEAVENTQDRFIEINLDPVRKDLRIASIYTNTINEAEDLCNWWNSMSPEWRSIIGANHIVIDTVKLASVARYVRDTVWIVSADGSDTIGIKANTTSIYTKLKSFLGLKVLNIANHQEIFDLEPVAKFRYAEFINCANTNVSDISPLRNLCELQYLNISNTHIADISTLRYLTEVTEIYAANTSIDDIAALEGFSKLQKLNISNTPVTDLTPIAKCSNIVELNVSGTGISRIDAVRRLKKLTALDISRTNVALLTPVEGLYKLKSIDFSSTKVETLVSLQGLMDISTVNCSRTKVSKLNYLKGHTRLHRIYCDSTQVTSETANRFVAENKHVLVIFETDALQIWWNNLPVYWKEVFLVGAKIENSPTTEDLHKIINIRSLDIHNNNKIHSLNQISRLAKLEKLVISGTNIKDISIMSDLSALKMVDLKNTKVSDISALSGLPNLALLNIEGTRVSRIDTLWRNPALKVIYADGSDVEQNEVYKLYVKNPVPRVTFQSAKLSEWWGTIDEDWRYILKSEIGIETELNPTSVQLHRIFYLTSLNVSPEVRIKSVEPVLQLIFLQSFKASNNDIRDIGPLQTCHLLKELEIDGNPVSSLEKLRGMKQLTSLNISGISAVDFGPLELLPNLEKLNVSSTQIRSLKPMSDMKSLRDLDISNTAVKSLDPVRNLPELKYLKANNTKIKKKTVVDLQKERVEMNIVYF